MRIVDMSALYSPSGGGIRTYTEQKLVRAARDGIDLVVVVPGIVDSERRIGSARMISVASPRFPLDRNYGYFRDDATVHRLLNELAPDMIECSSPWGSAAAVARWPGAVPRSLVMHADPMSAWAYRYLDPLFSRATIDRGFRWFWRHLAECDSLYDLIICASPSLKNRLTAQGLKRAELAPLGIEAGLFTPANRDEALRAEMLSRCGLGPDATLLVGVGRLSPEKAWPLVIDAVASAGIKKPLGLVLLGDGPARSVVQRAVGNNPHIVLLQPVKSRSHYAGIIASADALVHGCSVETYGLACAEARASGVPLIVPDAGGAFDQMAADAGLAWRAGDAASLRAALDELPQRLPALRAAALAAAAAVPSMDDHFDALFERYRGLIGSRVPRAQAS
ncbi:MAG: glycosyltransferase [Sphingomonadales bacterium]|jgi:alpha-1,6-mannosyltransferase